jgi:hypothetical protein
MPTWNKNWTDGQKAIARETRRRRYALARLQQGKSYRSNNEKESPMPEHMKERISAEAMEVLKELAERREK